MEASTTSCTDLQMTIISGENLYVNRGRPVRKNTFVVVQTDSQMAKSSKIDAQGGGYAAWNEKLELQVPMHSRFIRVQVQCKASTSHNKIIGQAEIPISDFVGGYFPHNYLHFLSYRLRNENGEPNEIINISIRAKITNGGCGCSGDSHRLSTWIKDRAANEVSNGIATGIPVWKTYI